MGGVLRIADWCIRRFKNYKESNAEMCSGIDTGDVPVSFLPFFLFPVTVPKTNINTDAHVSTPRYGHYLSMAATTGRG